MKTKSFKTNNFIHSYTSGYHLIICTAYIIAKVEIKYSGRAAVFHSTAPSSLLPLSELSVLIFVQNQKGGPLSFSPKVALTSQEVPLQSTRHLLYNIKMRLHSQVLQKKQKKFFYEREVKDVCISLRMILASWSRNLECEWED